MTETTKVYFICDYADSKAASINGAPNIGVEYMGDCGGRAILEDGTVIGRHHSSSYGWLRSDLKYHADKYMEGKPYEVIDFIGQETPERFLSNPPVNDKEN